MTDTLDVVFEPFASDTERTTVIFAGAELSFGQRARDLDAKAGGIVAKAAQAADFKGKSRTSFEILAPAKLDAHRLIVCGAGKTTDLTDNDWTMLGGYAAGQIMARKTESAGIVADFADTGDETPASVAALLGFGALLRRYSFTKYQTKKNGAQDGKNGDDAPAPEKDGLSRLVVRCAEPDKARAAFARLRGVANGIFMARDLVNEPANVLGPVEFAERVKELERYGVDVEILDVEQMAALGMNCLLAVGQGSVRPSRLCVMQWHGAKSKRAKPVCFVGKGVVFDTGGISIKPAAGMEDMKGDMGGAACVTGLMRALAERKANVNAIGLIGCVENMPSGSAIRPGDIVKSMSGQTVEILNTDAEGRLVLADVLWYAQERFKPKFVIDLATLTGAIMVALGKDYAGLYSNDEKLAAEIQDASKATAEKVWRMPLDKAYDKLIDSKNADMKNIGGRWGGANTAAQFLQRFIKDTPWAHIDIAGTAMDATRNDINQSWGSGWGVRLLDRLVADKHEKG
jgi:leucyl aminopeptidase